LTKTHISKCTKISKFGALLRLFFFWPALPARGLPTKILLFGYVDLDPRYIITESVKTLGRIAIFYLGIHPMYMVDSSALNIDE